MFPVFFSYIRPLGNFFSPYGILFFGKRGKYSASGTRRRNSRGHVAISPPTQCLYFMLSRCCCCNRARSSSSSSSSCKVQTSKEQQQRAATTAAKKSSDISIFMRETSGADVTPSPALLLNVDGQSGRSYPQLGSTRRGPPARSRPVRRGTH